MDLAEVLAAHGVHDTTASAELESAGAEGEVVEASGNQQQEDGRRGGVGQAASVAGTAAKAPAISTANWRGRGQTIVLLRSRIRALEAELKRYQTGAAVGTEAATGNSRANGDVMQVSSWSLSIRLCYCIMLYKPC